MKITIGHLYPDLLDLYGDRGNIQCLIYNENHDWTFISGSSESLRRQGKYSVPDEAMPVEGNRSRDDSI